MLTSKQTSLKSRDKISNGCPILAILDEDGLALEKTEYRQAFEALEERFG